MVKEDIISMYKEAKEKITEERLSGKFRNPRSKDRLERMIHEGALDYLLRDADKKTTMEVIHGIADGVFAEKGILISTEINVLKDIIRDNIHDEAVVSASFEAMETMLKNTTNDITNGNKNGTISKVDSMQEMLYAIADLRENYPNKLGKQTDSIHKEYKEMMKQCSLKGIYNENLAKNYPEISDYYHGRDVYELEVQLEKERQQTDEAWETKEQIDAAKQRIYNKFTKKEVAEYEQSHAEQVKREDAKYTKELKEFVKGHENRERSKEHQKQIDEIKLKHNDKLLEAAYENFKDVARKPGENDKSEKTASNEVPKRAVYVGRGKPRQ